MKIWFTSRSAVNYVGRDDLSEDARCVRYQDHNSLTEEHLIIQEFREPSGVYINAWKDIRSSMYNCTVMISNIGRLCVSRSQPLMCSKLLTRTHSLISQSEEVFFRICLTLILRKRNFTSRYTCISFKIFAADRIFTGNFKTRLALLHAIALRQWFMK